MNKTDQLLHDAIHQHMMSISPDQIFSDRVHIFDQLERKIGLGVHGQVLDMGCGSGYASIWLAKNKPVSKVYAQEASRQAVEQLLPRNISHHGVEGKVEALAGSFDAIPMKDSLDFVVSFGALHHSPCLFSTMRSVGESLKDGGYLIAQEPVMPNMTSNQDYIDKYNIIETMFGMQIRNGDRNDNFFREAEYIAAATFSGLDLVFYEDFTKPVPPFRKAKRALRDFAKRILVLLGIRMKSPELKADDPYRYLKTLMPKIMVFKKRNTDYIPHLWRGLEAKPGYSVEG
jgi:SAM-dependent methyltransferase